MMEADLPAKESAHVGQEMGVRIESSDTQSFVLLGAPKEKPKRISRPYIPK
jgi:hypothetical protein